MIAAGADVGGITNGVVRGRICVDHGGWRQAHASSVIRAGSSLLCAWFAGTHEGTPDNRIWLSMRELSSWSSPRVVAAGDEAHWNPVLAAGPEGDTWLFYKRGARISEWRTYVMRSSDAGVNWSDPEELVPGDVGGRGPVKNPPLLLADGVWLAPASTESWREPAVWTGFVDRSVDGGATWDARHLPLDRSQLRGAGVIQPALWTGHDAVYALTRSTEGSAYLSSSLDSGLSWSEQEATGLANNNSALTVVALGDGIVACVHNPVAGDWAARCPLAVSVSSDDGATWELAAIVEDGVTPLDDAEPPLIPSLPGRGGFAPADTGVLTDGLGEYSYPAAIVDDDELIITYTWQRRGIAEARVPLDVLVAAAPVISRSLKEPDQ